MATTLKRFKHSTKESSGFTLIELIVVVVILGILTAIAVPSYGAIQHTSRVNSLKATVNSQFVSNKADFAGGKYVKIETIDAGKPIELRNRNVWDTTGPLSEDNFMVQGTWRGDGPKTIHYYKWVQNGSIGEYFTETNR